MNTTKDEAKPSFGADRERQVRRIFSEIAPRYDLLNHVLSLNVDRRWRRKAVDRLRWERVPHGIFLDACAGTYDLSLELAGRRGFEGRIVGADFAWPMLAEGKAKIRACPVWPLCGDTLRLPFPDGTFDGAMVGFGVRNLADVKAGLAELHRVLRPGSRLVVLDFTLPRNRWVRSFYLFYFNRVLPLVGRLVSGHPWAYRYLPESVKEFPGPSEFGSWFEGAGFERVRWTLLTFGIAAIHVGEKDS